MPRTFFSIPKPTHNIFDKKISQRKHFKTSTRKMEWMSAGGRDPLKWKTNFVKKSKCRNRKCKNPHLKWGDRSYEFDHKDNNNSNNSQRNCYLVCRVCHGRATVIKKKKVRDRFTGIVTGHKTIKKKVGYKKPSRKKSTKKKNTKRKPANPWGIQPIKIPDFRF
jgi:hypothetical protein